MNDFDGYFSYLSKRSQVGLLYRRYLLYPKLSSCLRGKTLDIGCGIGDFLSFRAHTIGVDINPYAVEYCKKKGLDAHVMQPDQLPFAARTFDSVLLDNVLEHLDIPTKLLAEIKITMNPDGLVIIGVPGKKGWYSDPDHKIYYDEKSLTACMMNAGFKLQKVFYMPFGKSSFLSLKMRQYCMYAVFSMT